MPAPLLSPRDLAGALGVSESSLKRWIDAGRIPATRTDGGHRRISLADALAFVQSSGVAVVRPELLGLPDAVPSSMPLPADADLHRALLDGDARAVRSCVHTNYLRGMPLEELCDGPLRRAMYAIGELWAHDSDGIFVEHRATIVALGALADLSASLDVHPSAPLALGGAPENDPYQLPSMMASVVLGGAGWRTMNLGADTPLHAFERAIAALRPSLVWLSVSSPLADGQAADLAAFAAAHPEVVVGGQHAASVSAVSPAVRTLDSMAALVARARATMR